MSWHATDLVHVRLLVAISLSLGACGSSSSEAAPQVAPRPEPEPETTADDDRPAPVAAPVVDENGEPVEEMLLSDLGSSDESLGDVFHPGSRTRGLAATPTTPQDPDQPVERVIRGRVAVGAIEDESGDGVFDQTNLIRLLQARLRAIQTCYERELRNQPTLAGRVLVELTIAPTGEVSSTSVRENSTGSEAVGTCATRTIGRFRFNPGPEGGSITYALPFVFAQRP